MKTKFRTNPVRKKSYIVTREVNEVRDTVNRSVAEHRYRKELVVPRYPLVNPAKAFEILTECAKRKSFHASTLYLFILTQVQEKEDCQELSLIQSDIAKHLELSAGSICKAFALLEELGVITKIGKHHYKISPEMAWVGDHLSWAEALYEIKTGRPLETVVTEISNETI
jgi:hypothetical protein